MSRTENGGYVFPGGISMRDWFAGQALIGILAYGARHEKTASEKAYDQADAMLAARKAQP